MSVSVALEIGAGFVCDEDGRGLEEFRRCLSGSSYLDLFSPSLLSYLYCNKTDKGSA